MKPLTKLVKLIEQYSLGDPQNPNLQTGLEDIRTKFKQVSIRRFWNLSSVFFTLFDWWQKRLLYSLFSLEKKGILISYLNGQVVRTSVKFPVNVSPP